MELILQEHKGVLILQQYGLNFISDENLFRHVKETVEKYRFKINLKDFNSNLIDPIKLTFDTKVYKKSIEEVIESEIARQIDKSNTNHIGYFHQNIFKYIGEGWTVPEEGYDIINNELHYFVEMKNKHNTMNSSSSPKTYERMQKTLEKNPNATCLLVEVIAKKSQDTAWNVRLNKKLMSHPQIRRVSIDKFYELVTGDKDAFKKLCEILPSVIEDASNTLNENTINNSVIEELNSSSGNSLKNLYLFSFDKYEGFDDFDV